MKTIAKRVEELIVQWPLLKQGLGLGLLNTSAVARYIKLEVEQSIGEPVSEAAVLMALRRYQTNMPSLKTILPSDYLGDISLRSKLADLTYTNSPTLQRRLAKLAHDLPTQHYLTISRGLLQTSLIIHQDHVESTEHVLENEHQEKKVIQLTAVTLHLKQGHDQVTGILAYPLQLLAWKGIPVVEVVSTYDELNIILYDTDIETAFTTLNSALGQRR